MNNKLVGNKNNIVFYTDEEGNINIEVILQNEDVWLNAQAIAELFDVNDKAIYKHIANIYGQEELEEAQNAIQILNLKLNETQKLPFITNFYTFCTFFVMVLI